MNQSIQKLFSVFRSLKSLMGLYPEKGGVRRSCQWRLAPLFIFPSVIAIGAHADSELNSPSPSPEELIEFAMEWMQNEDHKSQPLIDLLDGSKRNPPGFGFVNFETPPVHPVDLSPGGDLLAVCNLPDYRVEFFDVATGTPQPVGSVTVGVDPVTARFRTSDEVWVVNHISDSISVVDVPALRVKTTIRTGDEPCDVVFAGDPARAFVTCSQINTVQVFNPDNPENPLTEIPIEAEDPRSLAISTGGDRVYAAVFESGNGSTVLGGGARDRSVINFPPNVVSHPLGPYGGQNPPPNDSSSFDPPINPLLPPPPRVGLIVKKDSGGGWRDDNDENWTPFVSGPMAGLSGRTPGWDLPDRDVAIIDVASAQVVGYATGLMNICMSLAVNPALDEVTVVGTDGINEVRFEPVINGKFLRVNMGFVSVSGPSSVNSFVKDLNPHLAPYEISSVSENLRFQSVGDPRGIVWNSAGTKAYVTGMGSNNMIVVNQSGDRAGMSPTIELGEGPAGLALDEARDRIYVLNRFEGSISVVSISAETEIQRVPFFDPTPESIRVGRKHLYDTHKNSGLGHTACGSCHVDGRMDRLAWDLGDPAGEMKEVSPQDHNLGGGLIPLIIGIEDFHPMKGPMTTQTLQDIIGHEPHHWRGDRDGLEEFNGAFDGLQGAPNLLSATEMQEYEDFLATLTFPPNPFRTLDNELPETIPLPGHLTTGRFGTEGLPLPDGNPRRGLEVYRDTDRRIDQGAFACVTCHTLPTGMGPDMVFSFPAGRYRDIPFGPNNERHHMLVSVDGSTNIAMKVPHLRNLFEKTGCNYSQESNRAGFGFQHDGTIDSIERFVSEGAFDVASDQEVADLVALMLSFSGSDFGVSGSSTDTLDPPGPSSQDSHAAVGCQLTLDGSGGEEELNDLIRRAETRRADLVVKGGWGGTNRGAYYDRKKNLFVTDRDGETMDALTLLSQASAGSELTFTLVPPDTGRRVGIDRDSDGCGDRTEIERGTNPHDPADRP